MQRRARFFSRNAVLRVGTVVNDDDDDHYDDDARINHA